jgi:hypothetical protein
MSSHGINECPGINLLKKGKKRDGSFKTLQ